MSLIQNMFNCCGRNDKTPLKSDIDINIIKSENDNNNIPIFFQTKDTQINLLSSKNIDPLITSPYSSSKNNIKLNSINIEKEDKSNFKFLKNVHNIIKDHENKNNLINNNPKIRATKTVGCRKNEDKNTVLSISDLSFVSENQKKESFSKLLLSGELFYGKEIIINDCGMVNSKRNKKDGFTVFGLKNSVDFSGKLNNDFIINFNREKEEIVNIDTDSGKVFEIKFNKKKKEYTLYFINPKLYLYYKVNNFIYFSPGKDYFLFVGKIFLSINIIKKENIQIINIQVDDTSENKQNTNEIQNYSFNENKSTIKIGRVNCDINISEKCISKIHGIIEFSKISQSFYYRDMSSTNGTTLLIKKGDSLKIKGEMFFKLEDVSFKIQEIP